MNHMRLATERSIKLDNQCPVCGGEAVTDAHLIRCERCCCSYDIKAMNDTILAIHRGHMIEARKLTVPKEGGA